MAAGLFLLLGVTIAPPAAFAGKVAGCTVFPANNVWNTRVDSLPVHPRSDAFVASIGSDTSLHPDFGSGTWEGGKIGIPVRGVPATQPFVPVSFYYDEDSDPGPYPIPTNAPIEGGPDSDGDRHVIVVQRETCLLYELFDAWPQPDGSWLAGSGAVFDLRGNALRPETWTSADAAGLPILAGLVRYREVRQGLIDHALRFTARRTRRAYVWPARHYASSITDENVPAMGQRFRLKPSFDVAAYPPEVQVILTAMKTYGIILADNGSDWFVSGRPSPRWDNDMLVSSFATVFGRDFEAVDVSSLVIDPDSAEARQP